MCLIKNVNNFINNFCMISDRAPSECSWDSNDDELRGSFSTDGDGKHTLYFFYRHFIIRFI